MAWRARVTGGMAGNLFLRAFERSDRIYAAMLSRGYDGEVRTLAAAAVRPAASWLVAGGWAWPCLALLLLFGISVLGMNAMHHSIEVEHLSFAYPDGHPALHDVSLHIAPGEKVALVGPNGAGKSTLMLHLNGILHRPEQARCVVCGLEVEQKNLGRVRAAVGLVFQNPDDQLFSPTVFDDVAFGPIYQGLPRAEVRARVTAALAAVRMSDYAERVSHHLSIGEKKRIAIATVLSMQPEILVLDEPTAGLDPRARRR